MQMKHPSIEHLREILGTSTPRGTKCDPLVLQWRFSAEGGRRFFLNFRLRLRICLKVHEGSICAKGLERCSNSFAKMTYQVTSANTISKYPLPNLQVAWFSMIYR